MARSETRRGRISMPLLGLAVCGLAASLTACSLPAVDDTVWTCEATADCGPNFACDLATLTCIPADEAGRNGVTNDAVQIGAILPLTAGPTTVGQGLRIGIEAAFQRVNARGGVFGRQVMLSVRDSAYDPEVALVAVGEFADGRDHLAIIGGPGGHVAALLRDQLSQRGVIFFSLAGSSEPSGPTGRAEFAVGSDDAAEVDALIDQATGEGIAAGNIGTIVQGRPSGRVADAHGASIQTATRAALSRRGIDELFVAVSPARSLDVDATVRPLLFWLADEARDLNARDRFEATILLGVDAPTASRLVRAAQVAVRDVVDSAQGAAQWGLDTSQRTRLTGLDALHFAAPGGIGGSAWSADLQVPGGGRDCAGLRLAETQMFYGADSDLTTEFRADLAAVDGAAKPGSSTLRGYLAGRAIIEALEAQGPEITADGFRSTLEMMTMFEMDLGADEGTTPDDHRFFETVRLLETDADCQWQPLR